MEPVSSPGPSQTAWDRSRASTSGAIDIYIQHLFNRNIYTKDSIRIVVKLNYIIVIYEGLVLEYLDHNDFLTNFYHSLVHFTGNLLLGRLHEKLFPEHTPFPNIGCPMIPPSFIPVISDQLS